MRSRRLLTMLGMLIAVSGATLWLTAAAAFAHHPVLSGATACPGEDHIVTWSIGNSEPAQPMTIISASAVLNGTTYTVTGYTSPIPGGGSTSATTTVPGDLAGTITLTVTGDWPDSFAATRTTTVDLVDPCTTTTTTGDTTTTTGETTTTTGETTTTTSESTTTTTSEPSTTTTSASTTTTSTPSETTTTTGTKTPGGDVGGPEQGPNHLPDTGGEQTGLALFAFGLLFAGLAMWLPRRSHAR